MTFTKINIHKESNSCRVYVETVEMLYKHVFFKKRIGKNEKREFVLVSFLN